MLGMRNRLWIAGLAIAMASPQINGQETSELKVGDEPAYLLRYKLKDGQQLKYQVTHIANTGTRIRGKDEETDVRSLSTKVWSVAAVDGETGQMTFDHSVQDTELSQKIGDADEIRWDSKSDDEPPYQFQQVKETLGKSLATVTINGQGQEQKRDNHAGSTANLGMGGLTVPLPPKPAKIGGRWAVPREVRVRLPGGESKAIAVREMYTLKKVRTGIATIEVNSQPITPIRNSKVKSQVVQQLSNGTIKFDIDAGHLISKQLDWDETVVGFEGAESMMKYRARLTETFLEESTNIANSSIDSLKIR